MIEEIKKIGKIVRQLWEEITGIKGEEVAKIVDEIDDVFHRNGYVIPRDKITHFVVDCIRENQRIYGRDKEGK